MLPIAALVAFPLMVQKLYGACAFLLALPVLFDVPFILPVEFELALPVPCVVLVAPPVPVFVLVEPEVPATPDGPLLLVESVPAHPVQKVATASRIEIVKARRI